MPFLAVVERTAQRQGKIEYNLKSPKLNSKVTGKITMDGDIRSSLPPFRDGAVKHEFDWNIEYQRPKVDQETHKFDIKYNVDYSKNGPTVKIDEQLKTKCSRYPQYNFDYKFTMDKTPEKIDVKLQTMDGSGRDFNFDLASKRSADNKFTGTANAKSTKLSLDHKSEFTYQNNLPNQFAATVKLDTPQTKDIRGEAKYTRTPGQAIEGEAKLNYPGRDVRIYKKLQKTEANKYKSQATVQWQKDKQIQLDSDITYNPQQNDYELKTVAKGVDAQQWTFNKKVKIGDDMSVRSAALLQKGTQTVYDWKLDLTKDGPKKQKLQAQLRSDYGNNKIDFSTDGTVEDLGTGRKVNFATKKDQKDFLKGELIVPKGYGLSEAQKQVKVDLSWDRNTVLLDYQRSKPKPDQIQLDATLKLDLPQNQVSVNRKLSAKISMGDAKTVNVTWFKDNAQVLDGSFGLVKKVPGQGAVTQVIGKDTAIDVVLKTFEPWTKRHIAGLATIKIDDNAADFAIRTENFQEKRKFGLRVGAFKEGPTKGRLETESNFNDRSMKTKHTYERDEAQSLRKLNGEIEYTEAGSPKKVVHEWSVKTAPIIQVTSKLQTPYAQLTDFDGMIELNKQGKQHNHKVDLKWNKNQNLKVQVKGDVAADVKNVDGSLQSTLTGLKSGQFTLKSDIRTGRDFEAK